MPVKHVLSGEQGAAALALLREAESLIRPNTGYYSLEKAAAWLAKYERWALAQ